MNVVRVLLAACCVLAAPAARAEETLPDRTLRVVAPWEIVGTDPAQSGFVFSRMQVAETLVTADGEGRLAPLLAERWSVSRDGLTWRFVLRSGAVFHDGSPVAARAVADALDRARKGAGILAQAPIAAIAADGSDTVTIGLTKPFAALPAFLAHYSTIVLAPASYDAEGKVGSIVGSGPYRVAALAPPLKMEVARFARWWGPAPAVATASYLAVGQGETRALMAESGEADVVFSALPVSIDRLRRNPRVEVRTVTVPRTRLLKLNVGSPLFDDVRERRALSLAIDRAGIARVILRNPDLAASQLFPPSLAGWHLPGVGVPKADPAAARRLFEEAGWRPGADGILEREGRRFSATLKTLSTWPELPVMATAIQAQAKEAGIEVKVSVGNASEIPSGHRDGSLEIGLLSRNFGLVPDPVGTLLTDYGSNGGDWGAMGWSSPELAAILDQLGAATDAVGRAALQTRVTEILAHDLPVIPIAWTELAVVVNKRVTGVAVDPLELSYHLAGMRWSGR